MDDHTTIAEKARSNGRKKKAAGPAYREFQFVVMPILLVDAGTGVPYTEQGEQIVCRGVEGLREYADRFPAALEQLNQHT